MTHEPLVDRLHDLERQLDQLRRERSALLVHRQARITDLTDLDRTAAEIAAALAADGVPRFAWRELDRRQPVSQLWGADRGRRVDRYYIEQFFDACAGDVRGIVLEAHDNTCTKRCGGDRVLRSDVLDSTPANVRASVIADLQHADEIASSSYDCIILAQTLRYMGDIRAALRHCRRLLKPGGILLATLPCASRLAPEAQPDGDFWRFTASAARRLLAECFAGDSVDVRSYGNVLTNIAFLYGLSCEDLTLAECEANDPYFPLILGVRARKSADS